MQFSNWPVCDGYITPFNVPSPPSYVPNTSTLFPGNGMNFVTRIRNFFAHWGFFNGRLIQTYLAKSIINQHSVVIILNIYIYNFKSYYCKF